MEGDGCWLKIIRMACLLSFNSTYAKRGTACWRGVLNFDEAAARYQLPIVLPDNKLRGDKSLADDTLQLKWTAFAKVDIGSTEDPNLKQNID